MATNRMNRTDRDFVIDLLRDFTLQRNIRQRLAFFQNPAIVEEKDRPLNDWEKWLHIEFSYYLASKRSTEFAEVTREWGYELDRRSRYSRDNNRKIARVDFTLEKKRSQGYLIIEFKVGRHRDHCVLGMYKDKVKIKAIKESEFDFRTVFYVGLVHDNDYEIPHEDWVYDRVDEKNDECEADEYCMKIVDYFDIGKTGVGLVIMA